jgi:hypothetical protein
MDKRSSLELPAIESMHGNIFPRGRPDCAHNQRSKPAGRLVKNTERALQSGYGRERILAPKQSCFCLEIGFAIEIFLPENQK